jgi:cytochrome c
VQQRIPNRLGMNTDHGLWPGAGFGHAKPDVRAAACMRNCGTEAAVASYLPEHARNAHGNLADQQRLVGAQRGAQTTGAAAATASATEPAAMVLARQLNCLACHGVDRRLVGPSLREVSQKYAGRSDASGYLAGKIVAGGSGVWGSIPMPPQSVPAADAQALAEWIAAGARP